MLNGTGQHPDDAREAALLMNIAGLGGSGGMKNGSANTGGNGPAAGGKTTNSNNSGDASAEEEGGQAKRRKRPKPQQRQAKAKTPDATNWCGPPLVLKDTRKVAIVISSKYCRQQDKTKSAMEVGGYSFDPKTKVDDPTAKRMMDAVVDNVKLYHGHGPIDDDNNNAPVLPVPFFRREENEKKGSMVMAPEFASLVIFLAKLGTALGIGPGQIGDKLFLVTCTYMKHMTYGSEGRETNEEQDRPRELREQEKRNWGAECSFYILYGSSPKLVFDEHRHEVPTLHEGFNGGAMTYPIDKVAAISAKPIFQVNIINNMWKGIGIHHPELRPTYCGAGRLRGWVGWDGNLERLLKAADQSSHNIDEDVRSRRGYLVGAYSGTTSQDSQDSTGKREFLATGWNYRWVTFIPHGSDHGRIHCFGLLGTNVQCTLRLLLMISGQVWRF